jgi:hypothetical protein
MFRRTLVLTLFAALVALAADKPNFSGSWKINATKSELGQMPAPEKFERTIEHKDPSMKVSTVQAMNGNERSSTMEYTINGQEQTVKTGMGEAKVTPVWKDSTLEVAIKRDFQGNEMKSVELWTLSADGKTLNVAFQLSGPMGEMAMKFVFDKQ